MSSRSAQIPLSDPYPLLITATRARMTGCAARCRVARHREAAIIGTCIKTTLGRSGQERMQALWRGTLHHRSSAFSKFPANSLLFVENSLLGIQKFPANSLDCTPCVRHENWEQVNQHIQQRYAGVEE